MNKRAGAVAALPRVLVAAACVWPVLLGAAVWARQGHAAAPSWTDVLYAAAAPVCHQRPDRSFFTNGVKWPVCGRCSGLYLAAPFGALLAYRRSRRASLVATAARARGLFAVAAIPTVASLVLEWTGLAAVSNLTRAAAALPLGAAIAWVLVGVASRPPRIDRVH